MMSSQKVRVLIGSPLGQHLVERIAAVDPRLEVVYRPDLLGRPRYEGDHIAPMERTAEQEAEWAALVAEAEVMFDTYRPSSSDLPRRAPRLKWIQFSSSGVGGFVQQYGLADSGVVVTNAAGIHGTALAEYVLFAMIYFARQMPRLHEEHRTHHWQRFAGRSISGSTLGIVGLGSVGQAIARLAEAAGVRVEALKRTTEGIDPQQYHVRKLYPPSELGSLLAAADYVVLSVPLTPETEGLIGESELLSMKQGAVVINISRGGVLDEVALVRALRSGHLAGAALDVFAVEPLPADSPLWDTPNVLITPHSMSTVVGENDVVVDLFCDNLRRYLTSEPLWNQYDSSRGY